MIGAHRSRGLCRRLIEDGIAAVTNVSHGSAHTIITDHLGFKKYVQDGLYDFDRKIEAAPNANLLK